MNHTDTPDNTSDVLVVGCGIVGASIAWNLARRGIAVRCFDPSPGNGATYAAAGMLAAVNEGTFGEHELARLNVRSAALWPDFARELAAETSHAVGLRETGTLTVAFDADDHKQLRRLLDLRQQWGLDAREIDVPEAREMEPSLGPRISGAMWAPGDHLADPRSVHRALISAIERRGVEIVHRRAQTLLQRAGGDTDTDPVIGVVDDTGERHHARLVVLAAGWESAGLVSRAIGTSGHVPHGARVPTRPVKGQVVRLDATHEPTFLLRRVVRGIVQDRQVYLVPKDDGEIVAGATSEEQPDDRKVTAGGIFAVLRDARALVPGIDELPVTDVTARARPGSPDNMPLIGPTSVPGLVVATGHFRNGVLLAPLTASAITEYCVDGALPDAVAAAIPTRFAPSPLIMNTSGAHSTIGVHDQRERGEEDG
ncbi:glycine oxidase ThiO [Actinobacteria bacterium YIM 96077]|uniref:glycine oxidase n=1 Tax=Phytoactinopolyspora halophila TaxID=1981511 RepID=A0A329R0P5_9ACTN|nr:glycine oxidase ThiO [Phytoactinopolyspora halophila]AYY15156.1 glycine oxidase ThiO [Actinobacteria bacterium YIM 96077]RAW17933.1 glycine oxidase ThiO [Phytoactinopolyspora halophila]